ncbi:UDP-2,4-diacetamido-2,4,6-trideoxy-beta-L-altropyranose hydrolase [Arcobacter porcinus]|uniref:UDP-2,4-diacetamido-2,4, 6-trideoxy-beta-L-altropyranose hydrolase n=1 Tax=Arcobacter porcinus TaxID=1935204 RepID=UPI000827C6FA|nr:UDP-2,4-diacetamido-2,4,6-trideoxy-beta-L-altropyranose hydrolase [Arcobacter porcinus]OCL83069.1 UDP-2,4-diacetamido-2,4,6-trideoxy-beta-L-altropyranose hydrolase [Arcobacter porcinus]
MNILIRADSSSFIGTGHIMRDLVLAKQFPKDSIVFATQDLVGNINHKILENEYKLEILKNDSLEELNQLIKKLNIDFIIIDHYGIDYSFEKKLKEKNINLKIFVLDDTYEKHYCDILLNHNLSADSKRYKSKVPASCELRCGNRYTLLRDEFLDAKKQIIKKDKKVKSIFVGMGGADNKSLNIKILRLIKKVRKGFKQNIKVNIVTTTANKSLEKLKKYCKNKSWINLQINSNEIARLMIKSDFVIVTPSVTVNEICYLELPLITIKTAKNQIDMHEYLKRNGHYTMKSFDNKKLKSFIKRLLNEKYKVN